MDLLRAQLARIQQQLSGLTASQKMLAAALVAIMAMTLIWWGRYAGQTDMEPLLDQTFSADDMSRINAFLEQNQIDHVVQTDRILVPADRKFGILADLGYNNLLPQNTNTGFDDIVNKEMTPWDSDSKDERLWLEIKQRTLSAVIGQFRGVRSAVVVIDPTVQRGFDNNDIKPTAMVSITMRDQEGGAAAEARKIALSAANMVAGAEGNGLTPGHVTVVVDGATIPIPDGDDDGGIGGAGSNLDDIRSAEDYFRNKILEQLAYIGGNIYASVRVDLNTKRVETDQTMLDPKNAVHLSTEEKEIDNQSQGPAPNSGGEPGAVPNTGVSLTGGGAGGGANTTESNTDNQYQVAIGQVRTTTRQAPGDAPPVSAAVRVPRSYFLDLYKDTHKGTDPDSDPAGLDALITDQLASITKDVLNSTGIKSADAVTVNWYDDGIGGAAAMLPEGAAAQSNLTAMLTSHFKEMGVGGLAVVSLFMVMMMARKSAPAPIPSEMPAAAERKGAQRPISDAQSSPEVGEGEKTLDGMELDSEAVQTQQVIEQVSDLVSENPDAAATLVKRWLNRS
ncbi:MAG TPA: flagellar M-ring protein FliF C-terminal domain-containing protein [Tepidisphaeraceae bacterium]|nr:flagellar M-ring protein FliF C-terminal domain-containing protein [Tepidisphaeraceae bacterium]